MFGMFYNGPLTRKQFWLNFIVLVIFFGIVSAVAQAVVGHDDELIQLILNLAGLAASFRLIYLRACDVGYEKPGQMTLCCLLPFVWLAIALLPTGSRIGCMLPCLPSTQKRWAREARARGIRLA